MVALSPVGKAGIACRGDRGRGACYASAVPSRTSLGKGRCSEERDDESGNREAASSEKLDEWMRESVVEGSDRNVAAPLRLQMEAASAESWPAIRRKWDRGAARPPDGIVLVEELAGDVENSDAPAEERGWSKTWGVPVQARGQDTSAACYILRTCRVPSAAGHSTHFCLARAKCFGDADDAQLREVWLLRRSQQKHQRRRRRRGW
ncbi:unnamed protein product [Spirodela intermedia]|uniref:DUF7804 domain-containing protein n=1 Tax=Spirodela intermedia TaxID=51605 RepID=A0A7I8JH00_SPIIN|nr:unnamed protein product [Spirodela intermedia]CAA6668823.1 unnamed protein product [Spirodela intermedia]